MRRVSHLIREVDRLANERRWTSTQLATELCVNRTLLAHIRAGRKPLTLPVLSRIAQVFGGKPLVRDLLFLHLAVEVPEEGATRLDAPPLAACALPDAVARAVRAYIASFPLAHLSGRSLLVQGAADVLARAATVLREGFQANDIGVMSLVASASLRASDEAAARRIPALIVERIEFASASVQSVLAARVAFGLPLLLTTTATLGALPEGLADALRPSVQIISATLPCPT